MLKKMNWRIVVLIVFMISAAGFIYWNMSTVHKIKKELAQYDKPSQLDKKPELQHVIRFGDGKPPDEPGFEWVQHGDHWDKVPINAHVRPVENDDEDLNPLTQSEIKELNRIIEKEGFNPENLTKRQLLHLSQTGVHWDLLTPDQQDKYDRDYYDRYGLTPPAEGHTYLWVAPGKPRLDANGNPVIIKKGDVYITVRYGQGFAPTFDQYVRYQSLQKQLIQVEDFLEPSELLKIQDEIDHIWQSAQGRIPIGATSVGGWELSSHQRQSKIRDALNNAYKELNLSHLMLSD